MNDVIAAENVQVGDRIRILDGEWLTVQTAAPVKEHEEVIRFTGYVDGDTRRYTHFLNVGEVVEMERKS